MDSPARAAAHQSVVTNLRAAMSNYSLTSPQGCLVESEAMALVDSGLPYAVFNAAVIDRPLTAALTPDLEAARDFYRHRRQPWSCWLSEGAGDPAMPAPCAALLRAASLRMIARHEAMAARSLTAAGPASALHIHPVDSPRVRRDFSRICGSVFGLPEWIAGAVYAQPGFWGGSLAGWVGYASGHPVSIVASGTAGGAIGIYSVATLPAARGKGYARRMTLHAIEAGSAKGGAGLIVLQSTPAGAPLYRKLGFESVGWVSVWATGDSGG